MAEPTVMDAINHALETGDVGAPTGDATPGPEADTDELETGATPEGGDADAGDSLEAGDDADAAGSAEEDGEGGEQGGEGADAGKQPDATVEDLAAEAKKLGIPTQRANGQFKSKEELAAEIAAKSAAGGKPGDKKGDPAAAKKPDAVNDPIPKDVAPATQERIRTLVKMTKDLEARATEATSNFDTLVSGLQATGTTPEQYGEVLSFMAMFNSQDPTQQEKALELIEGVADRLATLLGKERASSDPLKDHTDLKEAIAKGQITPAYAKEVARTRNAGKFRSELTAAHTEKSQAEAAAKQELDTARSDLNNLEQSLQKTDPQYAAKRAILVPILQPIFKSLPPSQWKAKFEETYKAIRVPGAAAKPNGGKPVVPVRQPMRAGASGGASAGGKGNSGMSSGSPTTALDAVSQALANMPR